MTPAQLELCAALALTGLAGAAVAAQGETTVRHAEVMPLAAESLVTDAQVTQFGAVAVGARGHVLLSGDFLDWRQAETVPTRATLTAVTFVGRRGWAVGHDTVILHSQDGGETWQRQHFSPERQQPLLNVLFLDRRRGYAIGAYDLFMVTSDGGRTWRESDGVDEWDDWHLNDIVRTEDGTFFIAAEEGLVYRSTDGTESWDAIDFPYRGSMFGLLEIAPNEVLAFGLRGNAFRSVDLGETWEPVDTGTDASLFGGRVLEDGTVMLVGSGGVIVERLPGADDFTVREHREGEPLAGVIQAPDGTLVYYGINGIGPESGRRGTP